MNIFLKVMEFFNFLKGNLYFNIGIIVAGIVIIIFTFNFFRDFYKITALGVAEMVKIQVNEFLKGEEKFDEVFDKVEKSDIYKNTILKYLKRDFLKKVLQYIYNKNKAIIKDTDGTKQ